MCTVTFIPSSLTDFILTSNRDEAPQRNTIAPKLYDKDTIKMLYPKDEVAGGTWIGLSDKKRLICLLNGGFTAHERQEMYRKSRGVIVIDLLISENSIDTINTYNFDGVEPFTVVLVDWERDLKLYELVWDGAQHHLTEKPIAPHIWSSSLLYTKEVKTLREQWFSSFLFEHLSPSASEVLDFHSTAGTGDVLSDLVMNRGFVKTMSITQITKYADEVSMRYKELQKQEITTVTL